VGCFGVGEGNDHYWLLHSLWHVFIQLATCCILLSLLEHPLLRELRKQQQSEQQPPLGAECCTPTRSLSEAIASGEDLQAAAQAEEALPRPLATAFWRVLQQSQMRLVTLQFEGQGPYLSQSQEGPQGGPPRADSRAALYAGGLQSLLGVMTPAHNLEQLLPVFTRLLLLQHGAHKRHRRAAQQQQQQQQQSEGARPLPSPAFADESLVRLGTASAVTAETLSPQTTESTSPTSSVSSAASELSEAGCLWCAAKATLSDETLLQVHSKRMRWACRLRLMPSLSCFLPPRWLWDPADPRSGPTQQDLPISHSGLLLCS
ncbi:hypothetical protein, conserved, partial [Eimeria tenella]